MIISNPFNNLPEKSYFRPYLTEYFPLGSLVPPWKYHFGIQIKEYFQIHYPTTHWGAAGGSSAILHQTQIKRITTPNGIIISFLQSKKYSAKFFKFCDQSLKKMYINNKERKIWRCF